MTGLQPFLSLLSAVIVLAFLYAGTFGFLLMERLMQARIQHREGPGRQGSVDPLQVWKDFLKIRSRQDQGFSLPFRFRMAVAAWGMLPALFLLTLLGGIFPAGMELVAMPSLLLLPLIAASTEALFLHASSDARERAEWRKRIFLRLMGASLLALSFLTAVLQVGLPSLSALSEAQSAFPYHSILSSPGLFLSGIGALGAVFLFSLESPIQNEAELSLGRSRHYLVFFVRKMWIFCLLGFWVFVYLGGTSTTMAMLLFPLKLAATLFVFSLLQNSFPLIRSADAGELSARWLFRLCLIGFLVEAVWAGVR